MRSEALFVWIYLPGTTAPVVAGRLDIHATPGGSIGTFVYGRSYLAFSPSADVPPEELESREFPLGSLRKKTRP